MKKQIINDFLELTKRLDIGNTKGEYSEMQQYLDMMALYSDQVSVNGKVKNHDKLYKSILEGFAEGKNLKEIVNGLRYNEALELMNFNAAAREKNLMSSLFLPKFYTPERMQSWYRCNNRKPVQDINLDLVSEGKFKKVKEQLDKTGMYNLKDGIPGVASYAEFLEMLDAKNNKKPDLTDKDKKNDFQIYAKNFISQERSAKSLNLDGFKIVDVKNRKKEIVVKRLDEESIRERKIPAGEKDIMDKCYDMLRAHKSLFSAINPERVI